MKNIVIENIRARFITMNDLAESLTSEQYSMSVNIPKYKTVEDHLWCIIGARESYFKALVAGEWQGFNCSLSDSCDKSDYQRALVATQEDFENILPDVTWSNSTEKLLANFYEHEIMHEGQLIRLIYGLGLDMPESSKWA